MQAVDRELSSIEVISKGFSLFIQHFARIVVPLLFGAILTGTVRLLFTYRLAPLQDQLSAFNLTETTVNSTYARQFQSVALQFYPLTELQGLILWIVAAPFFGLAFKVAYEASTANTPRLTWSLSAWAVKLPTIMISSLIVGTIVFALLASGLIGSLFVFIGLLLLVIPAILFIVMSLMFLPAVMLENESAISSLTRSRHLVARRWGKVFTVALVALIIYILLGTVFSLIFSFLDIHVSAVAQSFYNLISDVLGVSLLVTMYQSLLMKERGGPQVSPAYSGTPT